MQGRDFIEAGNLLVGDKLISVNGEDLLVKDYYIELTEESVSANNLSRVMIAEYGKTYISIGTGFATDYMTSELNLNPSQRMITGIASGVLMDYGLNKADNYFNWSGLRQQIDFSDIGNISAIKNADLPENMLNANVEVVESNNISGFKYKHNPSDNPKVLQDAIEDPLAVYGYRPRDDGSLSLFAKFDWSDLDFVKDAKQKRLEYIVKEKDLYDLVSKMKNEGFSTEEIARSVCDYRNQLRLNSYLDSNGNIINQEGYDTALKRMQTKSYDSLISSGKTPEQIINSCVKTNPAMDACVGLYDENYKIY